MKAKTTRIIRGWLRDMVLGAVIFMMMPVATLIATNSQHRWTLSEALARDAAAADTSRFAGPLAEYAVSVPAPTEIIPDPSRARQISDWAVLGLTFSLLVACNLAFLRHLRRVSASPRRD